VRELELARKEAGDLDEAMKEEMAVGQSRGTRLGAVGVMVMIDAWWSLKNSRMPREKLSFSELAHFVIAWHCCDGLKCLITAYDRIGSN